MKKDFLTLKDYSSDEIRALVDLSLQLKKERLTSTQRYDMAGKTAVLIFDKPSLRTRITFETAIYELGGNALNMSSANGRLGERESIADIAHNLERWVHLLVVRTFEDSAIRELSKTCSVPVINALTDQFHPCQSIALGITLREKFSNNKVRLAYLGDGNNVCASHMIYCAKMGYHFTAATPVGYEPNTQLVEEIRTEAVQNGGSIVITNDPFEAVKQADMIYTDVWASMGQEDEAAERKDIFGAFQVNAQLMAHAPQSCLFSHCLPAHRGDEVTDDVIDSAASVVFDEAENRLHAHKAIIVYLLNNR